MGKVKIKTLGDEEQEQEDLEKQKLKKEQKALREGKGKAVEEKSEEQMAGEAAQEVKEEAKAEKNPTSPEASRGKKDKFKKKSTKPTRSKAYQTLIAKVDRTKQYSLDEALKLLPELSRNKFDETVELHINTAEQGISGSMTLPHGTGKSIKVAIADDALLAKIEQGKIDFDILLAHPSMMPKLAKVAKILGPRGLMPNPKTGTVTPDPEEAAKKYAGGLMNFKTEAKSPIIHLTIGKVSFGAQKLTENIKTVMDVIPQTKVKNVTLKSTMSPGIKIQL